MKTTKRTIKNTTKSLTKPFQLYTLNFDPTSFQNYLELGETADNLDELKQKCVATVTQAYAKEDKVILAVSWKTEYSQELDASVWKLEVLPHYPGLHRGSGVLRRY